MPHPERPLARGRGAQVEPPNRFGGTYPVLDLAEVEQDQEYLERLRSRPTEFIPDRCRSIVAENDSPDVGFRYSLNPYRGCEHGCVYCFARPSHEYLGFNAGLDFETKILVKPEAPRLFREFLSRPGWKPEPIALAPNTDAYQPVERRLRLTRQCLEVAAEFGQPMALITKNALVLRDLDVLRPMAARGLVQVNVSVTTLDAQLARAMEPRTSTPDARLRAIRGLSDAGVPVRVFIAPVIPGLNDAEIPAILEAARDAGARGAGYTMLRLPLTVAPVFLEWLTRCYPDRAAKIEGRIRVMRGGRLNSSRFGERMSGRGVLAEQIAGLFRVFTRKYGLDGGLPPLDTTRFRVPRAKSGQLWLFD
jgi:DNA repair photolyase